MDLPLWLWIFLFLLALGLGVIPIFGTIYSFTMLILSTLFEWNPEQMFWIYIALIIGSFAGVLIGSLFEFGSVGLIWFWSRGCFSNLTSAIWHLGTVFLGFITGGVVGAGALILGIVAIRQKNKKKPKQCFAILGREICVGKEEV